MPPTTPSGSYSSYFRTSSTPRTHFPPATTTTTIEAVATASIVVVVVAAPHFLENKGQRLIFQPLGPLWGPALWAALLAIKL